MILWPEVEKLGEESFWKISFKLGILMKHPMEISNRQVCESEDQARSQIWRCKLGKHWLIDGP